MGRKIKIKGKIRIEFKFFLKKKSDKSSKPRTQFIKKKILKKTQLKIMGRILNAKIVKQKPRETQKMLNCRAVTHLKSVKISM